MRQRKSVSWVLLAAALTLGAMIALSGCGGFFTAQNNNPTGGSSGYVYVTNAGGTMAEYSLSSGVLTGLSGSPISISVPPTSVVAAPNNAFLYVGTTTGIFMYTINSDGTLTEGNNDTVIFLNQNLATGTSTLASVKSMVVDATSSWLIIAYQGSDEIDALSIDPTTGLANSTQAFPATATYNNDPNPQLAISPANNQVFVALGTGGTNAFGFNANATGTTSPWAGGNRVAIALAPTSVSANAVAVDSSSKYLFVAESASSTTSPAGMVRVISTASPANPDLDDETTGVSPSAVLADLTGAYVYVTNGTDGTISGFSLNTTTQKLTSLGTATPSEQSPVALVEDSSKSYVIDVGNGNNPNLWLYSFDASSAGVLDVGSTRSTSSTNPSVATGIAATH
jgi:6-phosphogluconolactonase